MSKSKNKSISYSGNVHEGQDSLWGLFARLFWSLVGNIILFFLAVKMFQSKSVFSYLDILFWIMAMLLIIVRYLDIKYLKGVNMEGLPATMGNWRKYAKYLLLVLAAIWIISKLPVFMAR